MDTYHEPGVSFEDPIKSILKSEGAGRDDQIMCNP